MGRELPERLDASLPADDPRFTGLRTEVAALVQRGRGSPVARLLGEYALLGWQLTHGYIQGPSGGDVMSEQQRASVRPPASRAATAAAAEAMAGLDFE